jgi:nucleotide-binding universal stress UspA family protein
MNTLLHPTDLSGPAITALHQAHAMCRGIGARLVVLHVFDIPTIMNSPVEAATFQQIDKEVHRINQAKLDEFCRAQLGDDAMKEGVRCMVLEHTSPKEAIARVADDVEADLIVVGARGGSKARELIMGSTTKSLITHGIRPVLVVPEEARAGIPRQLVQAIPLDDTAVNAVKKGIHFSDLFNASLTVVHVAAPEDADPAQRLDDLMVHVRERTGRADLRHELVRAPSVAAGLDAYLRGHPTDLLVMVEHERTGVFDMLFHVDKVTRMIFHTHVPTLVLHQGWPIA